MSWGVRMQYKTIGEINHYASENVNPARFPEQYFELYSVPHFSEGHPEIIKGKDVGATKQVVQEGDVLICKINPRINRVWKVTRHTDYPLIASSEWVIVRNADLNADYLTYYFSSPKFRVLINSELTGMGGSLTRAQPKQIRRYSVPVPDKEEQHFVVRNLALLDHLISLRQQQAEKLDELDKARFVELFGDPVRNTKLFPQHELKEYIQFLTSGSRGWAKFFSDDGELFITIKNVKNGHINLSDIQHVMPPDNAEAKRTKVQAGDLLISITADLGRTGVVSDNLAQRGAYINQHLTCIRLKKDEVLPQYVSAFLESAAGKRQFSAKNQSAVKAGLNFEAIKSLRLFMPPLELQREYIAFVNEVDREKERIQRSAALLETLKRSLMQQYFG